jgi:hypothetical protein
VARVAALLLLVACAGREETELRAAMLPIAGEVVESRTRVEKVSCAAGRSASAAAAELAAALPAAGWRDVVVEPHPAVAGRWLVRGVRDGGLGLAGRVDEGAPGCAGARVALGVHEVRAGGARRTAGPTGLARPARLPVSP